MTRTLLDDLGGEVELPDGPVTRVVSLVPSLTEAFTATRREALVGATEWCTHPADLDVARVRGTKNPDLAAVAALEPELVVCVQEENRELDVRRMRNAGIPVWVGVIESVDDALRVMRVLVEDVLGWGMPDWLTRATDLLGAGAEGAGAPHTPGQRTRCWTQSAHSHPAPASIENTSTCSPWRSSPSTAMATSVGPFGSRTMSTSASAGPPAHSVSTCSTSRMNRPRRRSVYQRPGTAPTCSPLPMCGM